MPSIWSSCCPIGAAFRPGPSSSSSSRRVPLIMHRPPPAPQLAPVELAGAADRRTNRPPRLAQAARTRTNCALAALARLESLYLRSTELTFVFSPAFPPFRSPETELTLRAATKVGPSLADSPPLGSSRRRRRRRSPCRVLHLGIWRAGAACSGGRASLATRMHFGCGGCGGCGGVNWRPLASSNTSDTGRSPARVPGGARAARAAPALAHCAPCMQINALARASTSGQECGRFIGPGRANAKPELHLPPAC